MQQELNLPRGYLSHSQIECWTKSKKDYRKRYYEGVPMYKTPELEFGSKIGKEYEMLHTEESWPVTHDVVRRIPRGTTPEFELRFELRGVPILGYIDSLNEPNLKIHELKSGKTPWTQTRANNHKQLKMYCAGVKALRGEYNPYVTLHWIETENYEMQVDVDGMMMPTKGIRLTGNLYPFHVTVNLSDIEEYGRHVEKVAREISEDYKVWKRLHETH